MRYRDGRVLAGLDTLAMGRSKDARVPTCVHRRCTELLWPRSLSNLGAIEEACELLWSVVQCNEVVSEGWLSWRAGGEAAA